VGDYLVMHSLAGDDFARVHGGYRTLAAALDTAYELRIAEPAADPYVLIDERVAVFPALVEQQPSPQSDARWEACLVIADGSGRLDLVSCTGCTAWPTDELSAFWPPTPDAASACTCAWCGAGSDQLVPLMRDELGFVYQCAECFGWTDSSPEDPLRPYRALRLTALARDLES
jgi:hypothetical protein